MKRFNQYQKFRIVINEVHFYTNAKTIRYGVGDNMFVNMSIQKALEALEAYRAANKIKTVGLAGFWEGRNVQIDMI